MLYAQITDMNGLSSIEKVFRRNGSTTYHLGFDRKDNLFTRTDLFLWLHGKTSGLPLSDFEKF